MLSKKRFAVFALVCSWILIGLAFQNCSPGVNFSEQSPASASTAPDPTATSAPTPTVSETVSCDAGAHRVIGSDGACICDFNGGYFDVGGHCQLTSALEDLCTPAPAGCGSVSMPAASDVFDFNSASLGSSQVVFSGGSAMALYGNTGLFGQTALVNESICGESRKVLSFPKGVGLKQFSTSLLGQVNQNYSIAILFRFNDSTSSSCSATWARIFDGKGGSMDQGLYMYGNSDARSLEFYSFNPGSARSARNDYAWVVFTKNESTISGFLNRQLQWQYQDTAGWSNLLTTKEMRFFKDDGVVPNEECEGAVAKILVFNTALSNAQAQCLNH